MTDIGLDRILVASDFSEAAAVAVDWGAELAAAHAAELVLVHALPPAVAPAPPAAGVALPPVTAGREMAERELAAVAQRLSARDVRVDVEVVAGSAGDALTAAAEARRADLVVVGTEGATGLARLVLGSVAARLAQACPCPLLTVRPGATPGAPKRLLAPIGPDDDLLALDAARRVLAPFAQPSVVLLHAFERPAGFYRYGEPGDYPPAVAEERARAQDRLEELASRLRGEGCVVGTEVRDGDPASVIEEAVAAEPVDFVAMATRGLGALERMVLGSTARHVLPRVPTPVLSVRRDSARADS